MVSQQTPTGVQTYRRRRRSRLAWVVAAGATTAAVVLYGVQIAAAISVRDELLRTCDSHPPLETDRFFWMTMLLSAVGLVAALTSAISTRKRLTQFTAVALVLVSGVVFLLAWYGFSVRNDTIGPLCSNM